MDVIVTPQARKQYSHIPANHQKKIGKKLAILEDQPHSGKKLTGDLRGLFSLAVWPYRIIYMIRNKKIWIVSILHRQGAYKN